VKEIVISRRELGKLPEYSCSIPTGTTIGKRWRRRTNYNDPNSDWCIGEYVPYPSPGTVGIKWRWAIDANGEVHFVPLWYGEEL